MLILSNKTRRLKCKKPLTHALGTPSIKSTLMVTILYKDKIKSFTYCCMKISLCSLYRTK